jgi:amidohydrolase
MPRTLVFLLVSFTCSWTQTLDESVTKQLPELVATFQTLHAAPELSHFEKNTARFMADRLKALGYDVTEQFGQYRNPQLACYGLVALFKNGPGPTVLFRADMDALPIEEKTGLSYASKVMMKNDQDETVPVMHACGHDMHCTVLLGIAKTLKQLQKQWTGTLLLIVQPAEEVNDSGGYAMIRAGLYEKFLKPDFALTYHTAPQVQAGCVQYIPGNCGADATGVTVIVQGVGGHGAAPQRAIDPIVLSAQIILALQTIVSREIDPFEPAVVTVGSIHGGSADNIIPDRVTLQLTIRCYKKEIREKIIASIKRKCLNLAESVGMPPDRLPEVQVKGSCASVYNQPELTQSVVKSLERALGKESLQQGTASTGAEDFAAYSLDGQVPSALFRLGVTDSSLLRSSRDGQSIPGLHSSEYVITAEPAIRAGVKGMSAAIMELMKK